MTLTAEEACIFHLYTISPMQMIRYTTRWDLQAASQYLQSMAEGNSHEQAAADALIISEVYQIMQAYLSKDGQYEDDDVMGAYHMDPDMYTKLRCYLYGGLINKEETA